MNKYRIQIHQNEACVTLHVSTRLHSENRTLFEGPQIHRAWETVSNIPGLEGVRNITPHSVRFEIASSVFDPEDVTEQAFTALRPMLGEGEWEKLPTIRDIHYGGNMFPPATPPDVPVEAGAGNP